MVPMISIRVGLARTVRAPTGRTIGYYEYGDSLGTPLVALHGTPASGAGFGWIDEPARARGIRVLAPDRPGIGDTDASPRSGPAVVADYPPELAAFADALGLETFTVLGYSGGGPYAVAAAHAYTERVHMAAIVSGAGNVGVWSSIDDFEATDRQLTHLSLRAPALARAALSASNLVARVLPALSLRFALAEMTPPDRALMKNFASSRDALLLFTQALRNGAGGVVDDYAALGRPWGFPVEQVRVPMLCWHGTDDHIVPFRDSESLVARVPGARLTPWDGAGHLAIIERVGEVLDALTGVGDLTE